MRAWLFTILHNLNVEQGRRRNRAAAEIISISGDETPNIPPPTQEIGRADRTVHVQGPRLPHGHTIRASWFRPIRHDVSPPRGGRHGRFLLVGRAVGLSVDLIDGPGRPARPGPDGIRKASRPRETNELNHTPISKASKMIRYFNIVCLSVAILFAGLSSDSAAAEKKLSLMIVAGGCFWCVESDFDHVTGVVETISGYTGGHLKNPTYRDVTSGGSGHLEAVAIKYDPDKTDYATLLDVFWRSVDPTDGGGQFCDRGKSYSTAIYTTSPEQKNRAEASRAALEASGVLKRSVATKILDASAFYPAEDYHQNYYRTNPLRYRFYRFNCGRDQRIVDLWGDEAHKGIEKH